jgi:hypothetical protein
LRPGPLERKKDPAPLRGPDQRFAELVALSSTSPNRLFDLGVAPSSYNRLVGVST